MIRTEAEYRQTVKRCGEQAERIESERARLKADGRKKREIDRALAAVKTMHSQLQEEIDEYERLKRGEFDTSAEFQNLGGMGVLLIRLRIASGLTQRELADRLGVDDSQVSRDERNEYHGITMDRANKILDALGVDVTSCVRSLGPRKVFVR